MSTIRKLMTVLSLVGLAAVSLPAIADASARSLTPEVSAEWDGRTPDICRKTADHRVNDDDYVYLDAGPEAYLTKGFDANVLQDPATVEWYNGNGCEFAWLVGGLWISDIGPTCVRVRFESLSENNSVGEVTSDELCQSGINEGAEYVPISLPGPSTAYLTSVKVFLEMQSNNGDWIVLAEKGRSVLS